MGSAGLGAVLGRVNAEPAPAPGGEAVDGSARDTVVALSLNPEEAAAQCAAAGVSVLSIAIRDGEGCEIECANRAGADELRLRFADHLLAQLPGQTG